ncbi:MAG: WD40 repeat domain-containing protein [Planctomycetota bacterium]
MNLTEIWSRLTPGDLTAATLTAEGVALGDAGGLLLLVSEKGEALTEHPLPAPIHDLAASPDGDTLAVACGDGEIVFLTGHEIAFRTQLDPGKCMVAVGPHGDYVLALSPDGDGVFLNRYGREMRRIAHQESVASVTMIRKTGQIVTVSRQGVVNSFASWGKPLWRAELMRADGRITSDDRGHLVLVPAMAYGVEALTGEGRLIGAYDIGEPVRSASCSGDGETLLFATSQDRLVLLKKDATVLSAERFPAPIAQVDMSSDGRRALVTTSSGYAHLMAVTGASESPLLELEEAQAGTRPYYLLKKRVYSPFSMLIQSRLDFAPDGSFVAVAGDRKKVQVLDLEGDEIAKRRYGGSLLDLQVTPEGHVRVFATQAVFRFDPQNDGSIPEWAGQPELTRVTQEPGGSTVALTESGEVLRLTGGAVPERLFHLRDPLVEDLAVAGGSVSVALKSGQVMVLSEDGKQLGASGPWPAGPQLVAASELGFLVAVKKLLLLLSLEGEELWRKHLSSPVTLGLALPGAFLVLDEAGNAQSVTAGGMVRRAFVSRATQVVPFADGGEGPGFLLVEGNLLTAVHPDGSPRWRFRTPDEITYIRASADGLLAAALAGLDLYVFPLIREAEGEGGGDAVRYLEFADG